MNDKKLMFVWFILCWSTYLVSLVTVGVNAVSGVEPERLGYVAQVWAALCTYIVISDVFSLGMTGYLELQSRWLP